MEPFLFQTMRRAFSHLMNEPPFSDRAYYLGGAYFEKREWNQAKK